MIRSPFSNDLQALSRKHYQAICLGYSLEIYPFLHLSFRFSIRELSKCRQMILSHILSLQSIFLSIYYDISKFLLLVSAPYQQCYRLVFLILPEIKFHPQIITPESWIYYSSYILNCYTINQLSQPSIAQQPLYYFTFLRRRNAKSHPFKLFIWYLNFRGLINSGEFQNTEPNGIKSQASVYN